MSIEWIVVVVPAGRVLAVGAGAPSSWVGEDVDGSPHLPPRVRDAGRSLLDCLAAEPPLSLGEIRLPAAEPYPAIRVLALRALPVHAAVVDPLPVLSEALAPVRTRARARGVGFSLWAAPDLPRRVGLDAAKISWCVATLAGEALGAVRQGGLYAPGGEVRVSLSRDRVRGTLDISVADDGPGLPADRLARLLGPGPPGSASSGRAGLPLVHQIVAAHGGSVLVSSSTDPVRHGTTITLRLPVVGARSSPEP